MGTEDIKLACQVHGQGTPVVWLHAFPLDQAMWRPQLMLAEHCQMITIDLPGFGRSRLPKSGWSIDSASDAVIATLDEHSITRPVVVAGLSMGGYVALALARRHADRLSGLILANTKAEADNEAAKQSRDTMIQLARSGGPNAIANAMLPRALGDTSHKQRSDVVAEVHRIMVRQFPNSIAAALQALKDRPDATPGLKEIRVPTLVIVGEEDVITPPSVAQSLFESIKPARLVVLPQAGHLSNLEVPDAFNRATLDFLAQL